VYGAHAVLNTSGGENCVERAWILDPIDWSSGGETKRFTKACCRWRQRPPSRFG
jgi:hypothetical protein